MTNPTALAGPRMQPRPWSIELPVLLMSLLLAVVAFVVLAPLALLLISSFQLAPPGQEPVYGLQGWTRAYTDASVRSAIGNTVALAIVRQAIALVVGVLLAWLIARTDLPGKGWLEFAFWVAFFLPQLPLAMGWIMLLDGRFGLVNQTLMSLPFIREPVFEIHSFWGIVWVGLTTSIGVKVMLLTPAFRNLDASLEETSRSCGANNLSTLARVVVPLMAPAILVSLVLGLIRSLESFEIELLLGVPVGLFVYSTKIRDFLAFQPVQYAPAAALGAIFLVVLLLLVTLQRRYLGRRLYRTVSGRGFSARPTALDNWRWVIFAIVALVAVLITVVPSAVLLMGTFMNAFGYFNIPQPWTFRHWERVLSDPILIQSLRNTLVVGVGAALLGVLVYTPIAYVVVKTRFAGRAALDLLSWLPWAIPGILLGMALLWTVFRAPFLVSAYGTLQLLIVALVIKSMPFGIQLTKTILMQLGDELEEASRIGGASWLSTFRRIILPLLAPTLITVALIGFMSAARDISTVVLLSSSESRTLALLALDFAYGGQFEQGTIVAVLTVLLVLGAALLARMIGGRLGVGGA